MDKRTHLSVLLVLAALASCSPQMMRVDVGAASTSLKGQFALQNTDGDLVLGNEQNTFGSGLAGGEDQTSLYLRAESFSGAHHVKVSGFRNQSSGSGVLAGDFGDIPGGTAVTSSVDFSDITGSWAYDVLPQDDLRLGFGVQVGWHSLDLSVRSTTPSGFEDTTVDQVSPMPYAEFEWNVGPFDLGVNGGVMQIDLRDTVARYWDAEAYARLRIAKHLEVMAGWRYILQDAHGRATGRDFDTDYEVNGLFLAGGIRF